MTYKIVPLLILVTFSLGTATDQEADQLSQSFQLRDGYIISLPSDWVELPNEALVSMAAQVNSMSGSDRRVKYDYGFQAKPFKDRVELPYIILMYLTGGRYDESQLEGLERLQSVLDETTKKYGPNFEEFVQKVKLSVQYYEEETNTIWYHMTGSLQGVGEIEAITGGRLTGMGMIVIYCYALKDEFDDYLPLFMDIVHKFHIPEYLKYK